MSSLITRERPGFLTTAEIFAPISLFEEMDRLTREVEKLAFSFFEERGKMPGFDLSDWFRAEAELLRPMPIEVEEAEKEVVVRAEVPGFEPKEISVTADPWTLRIYGKVEKREKEPPKEELKEEVKEEVKEVKEANKPEGLRYSEIAKNEVLREITLPVAINPDQTVARLEKGVLEIRLPKAAPPKLIQVKAA